MNFFEISFKSIDKWTNSTDIANICEFLQNSVNNANIFDGEDKPSRPGLYFQLFEETLLLLFILRFLLL